jgi:ATP-dependent Clp protease protease subunit
MRLKERLIDIFVHHTNRDKDVIERDQDRDIYLSATQAVEYGLIDTVLESHTVGENNR